MSVFRPLATAIAAIVLMLSATGCMKWDYVLPEDFSAPERGLFIASEGNFQYSNASLNFYNPSTQEVYDEIFIRANGFKLGDVAQSMTVRDDKGWIVVNHSHVIFAIDASTFKEVGRIENLPSPRYIHFISDRKAYVSQLWDNRIFIVDPTRYEITGTITVPGMLAESGSTEQMVQVGRYVYANCWSYNDRIIKIDTETDQVVAELHVGLQPRSIVLDYHGKLWVMTDGGYEGSPFGNEAPALYRIDLESFSVERSWTFEADSNPVELQIADEGHTLYWINYHVWKMDVDADELPTKPFLTSKGTIYYGLTISPYDGDIYVADAIDYQQAGKIYRYSPSGVLIDEFYAGIIPGAFAWK